MLDLTNHKEELKEFTRQYAAGDNLFTEGDDAGHFFILINGEVDIYKGKKKVSEISMPGSIFGEMSLVLETKRTATVIARTDVTVLCIPNPELKNITKRFPEFTEKLTLSLASRLYETTNIAHGLQEFCDRLPDAVIMADINQKVVSWNQAAEKLFGRDWHRMQNSSVAEIFDNQPAFHHLMADLQNKESIRELTLKISHPEESWKFVSTSTKVLRDPHNTILGFLFISRDITVHQKLEESHRRVKTRLIPLLLLVALVAGLLSWTLATFLRPAHVISTTQQIIDFTSRLSADHAALDILLLPYASDSQKVPTDLIEEYFELHNPKRYGINGLILLDSQRRIVSFYSIKFTEDTTDLIGTIYSGVRFVPDTGIEPNQPTLFMVTRESQAGGKSVEIAFDMVRDQQVVGWLVFQLDLELLHQKFNLDIKSLSKLRFPNL